MPFEILIDRVLVGPAIGDWALAAILSAALLAVHLAWLFSTDVSFPETPVSALGPVSRRRSARRRVTIHAPHGALGAPHGALHTAAFIERSPALAVSWKNLRTGWRTQLLALQIGMVLGVPALLAVTALPALRHLKGG